MHSGRELEASRIREEYARRDAEIPAQKYSLGNPVNVFFVEQRTRRALEMLQCSGLLPFSGKKILEVGCGTRGWLSDFESWGAKRSDLCGIDLNPSRIQLCRRLFCPERGEDGTILSPGADIRLGDASDLPWPDRSFEIVIQSTMMTSILDERVKLRVASEMLRVLRPEGAILWYDFAFDNPKNPNVRGIKKREIRDLFPYCRVRLKRVTLAPPLARMLVSKSWLAATFLETLRVLNSHLIGTIMRRETDSKEVAASQK